MKYVDCIWGEVEILDGVVVELIKTPSLQRLKNIDQLGYTGSSLNGNKHNRFNHSLGCYLLLSNFGALLEERVHGLIHDVSHSVFSHCVDYALSVGSEAKQDHQDNIFKDFVRNTEIPGIIKKYNLDLDYILEESNFPLQERGLPELCADRIDYLLRDSIYYGSIDNNKAQDFLSHIMIVGDNWVFDNVGIADEFARLFLAINEDHYSSSDSAVVNRATGNFLKHILEKKYITKDDLYSTEDAVLYKTEKYLDNDTELARYNKRMNDSKCYKLDDENSDTQIQVKSRIVDPLVFEAGKTRKLSEIKPDWSEVVSTRIGPKKYNVRYLY